MKKKNKTMKEHISPLPPISIMTHAVQVTAPAVQEVSKASFIPITA